MSKKWEKSRHVTPAAPGWNIIYLCDDFSVVRDPIVAWVVELSVNATDDRTITSASPVSLNVGETDDDGFIESPDGQVTKTEDCIWDSVEAWVKAMKAAKEVK